MWHFSRNFFSPIFQTKKLEKISKKWKILKSAKKKNCQKWPKSFRNWVKPILGTKKWPFSRKFFFAHFSDQKTRKTFKKMKNLKNCQKWPKSFRNWVNQFWALKMTLLEKIFFAHFSDQETRKTFKKMKNLKNCQKWPKTFRNWVNPILGTKKWHFSRNFFSPIF